MSRSILIVGSEKSPYLLETEKKIFAAGYKTLFVVGARNAVEKLEEESFTAIIYDALCDEREKISFLEEISGDPFASVTPIVILAGPSTRVDPVKFSSTLDQVFSTENSPDYVADYVKELHGTLSRKVKKGNLSKNSVPKILYRANSTKFSGSIIFERVADKKVIYLNSGNIVFASSNRKEERFGEFMVNQGLISRDQLDQALAISSKSSLKFGQILVEMGFIKQDSLAPLLQSQVKHILFNIFNWNQGDFFLLFEPGDAGPGEAVAQFKIPSLILEGIRRVYTAGDLSRFLNPLAREVSIDVKWRPALSVFPFNQTELILIEKLFGGETIEVLIKVSPISELETLRIIYLLYAVGLLSIEKDIAEMKGEVVPKRTILFETEGKPLEKPVQATGAGAPTLAKAAEKTVPTGTAPVARTIPESGTKIAPRKMSVAVKVLVSVVIAVPVLFAAYLYFFINESFKVKNSGDGAKVAVKESVDVVIATPDATRAPVSLNGPPPESVEKRGYAGTVQKKAEEPKAQAPAKPAVSEPPVKKPPLQKRDNGAERLSYYMKIGKDSYDSGNLDEALKVYMKAYAINRRDGKLLVEIARVYFDLDRSVEAIEKYKEALAADGDNADAYLGLGNIYQYHGKESLAIEAYKTFLALAPNDQRSSEIKRILSTLEGKQ